jgi:hypothetical protein
MGEPHYSATLPPAPTGSRVGPTAGVDAVARSQLLSIPSLSHMFYQLLFRKRVRPIREILLYV